MNELGAALVRAAGWDWGRHVRAGMLFRIDGGLLRVRGRRGGLGQSHEPDPHDVLTLVRQLQRGAPVQLVVDDPATDGWLRALAGVGRDDLGAQALLRCLSPGLRLAHPPAAE